MKSLIFTFSIVCLITLGSCQKTYTCSCVQTYIEPAYSYNGTNYQAVTNISTTNNYFKSKKKNAESGCKLGESITSTPSPKANQGQGNIITTVSCELK